MSHTSPIVNKLPYRRLSLIGPSQKSRKTWWKGLLLSAIKYRALKIFKCNYLRTKKYHKQTNKNRTNKIVARCGGYHRQDCQRRTKAG